MPSACPTQRLRHTVVGGGGRRRRCGGGGGDGGAGGAGGGRWIQNWGTTAAANVLESVNQSQ